MGLFGNSEAKEAKKQEKLNKLMEKYGLNKLDPEYQEKVKLINYELMGTGLTELGLAFSGKPEDNVKIHYLNAIIEQNWIIIRLLNDLKK